VFRIGVQPLRMARPASLRSLERPVSAVIAPVDGVVSRTYAASPPLHTTLAESTEHDPACRRSGVDLGSDERVERVSGLEHALLVFDLSVRYASATRPCVCWSCADLVHLIPVKAELEDVKPKHPELSLYERTVQHTTYHPGMLCPKLTVMGIVGACGNTHLTCARAGSRRSICVRTLSLGHVRYCAGTRTSPTGFQPWPESPSPCTKMTVAVCFAAGAMVTALSRVAADMVGASRGELRRSRVSRTVRDAKSSSEAVRERRKGHIGMPARMLRRGPTKRGHVRPETAWLFSAARSAPDTFGVHASTDWSTGEDWCSEISHDRMSRTFFITRHNASI
jgi:hypothetical protein